MEQPERLARHLMEMGHLNPACLPPGTQVGPWRVLELRGQGTYGAVYRAVLATRESADSVALKLALFPWDERFPREVELLSRTRHPAVPRLRDHGHWQYPAGTPYPYLVMDLVEGAPLYDWARAQRPTSRQVLRLLARLARALEATHAAGGIHRDVKGGNILVRREDGQVFLTDFGSGHYLGAATLTGHPFPPGTPAYRSPEAWRSVSRLGKPLAPPYAPTPADDVFALGVTAYRLISEQYPPSTHPDDAESRLWHLEDAAPCSPRARNPRCCQELSTIVSRMLSPRPEARGSACELAESLEHAARWAGPEADVPLFPQQAPRPPDVRRMARDVAPQPARPGWWPWLAAASVGGPLAFGAGWVLSTVPGLEPAQTRVAEEVETRDAGTVAVGDTALTAPVAPAQAPSAWSTIAVDLPPKPLPGQIRPDATGRCPHRTQVPIHGGCWMRLAVDLKDCEGDSYVYKGGCYTPALRPARPPTSGPTERTDAP